MKAGVSKCGIMVCEGSRELRESVRATDWPLQGEFIPIVHSYKYLGVLLQDSGTYELKKFELSQAKKLGLVINQLRPFLYSTVGGESYSMGHSWSGEDAQILRGTGRPGFVPVSMFLGTVCPTQMGVLWKWRPELDGNVR